MDMSLRDLLILIGIAFIAAVFIGGFYRMHLAKKRANELHFGLEEVKGDMDAFGSELPNGGARKSGQSDSEGVKEQRVPKDRRVEPEFSMLDLDNTESTIEKNVDTRSVNPQKPASKDAVNTFTARSNDSGDNALFTALKQTAAERLNKRKVREKNDFMPHEQDNQLEGLRVEEPIRFKNKTGDYTNRSIKRPDFALPESKSNITEKLSDRPPAQEVVAINVVAKRDQIFNGGKLLQSLLKSGMRFGDMSIFHRYANDNGTGRIQFSLANGVEPGIFDIDKIDRSAIPVVSFFMGLPGPKEPVKAFTQMVETAKQLAFDLGGELKDDQFSVMTQQTIEHTRQRIIDYERKKLVQRIPS